MSVLGHLILYIHIYAILIEMIAINGEQVYFAFCHLYRKYYEWIVDKANFNEKIEDILTE